MRFCAFNDFDGENRHLTSDQGISHLSVPKGVSMGPHDKKTTFPAEFCDECYNMYSYTTNYYIQEKYLENDIPFQNSVQIPDFHFASF